LDEEGVFVFMCLIGSLLPITRLGVQLQNISAPAPFWTAAHFFQFLNPIVV